MKTNNQNSIFHLNDERMKKKLKQNEKGFVLKTTQSALNPFTKDTHLQLELELAEIFGLNVEKVQTLIEWHNEKAPLTIANVMDDMERILNLDRINKEEKQKEYVYIS